MSEAVGTIAWKRVQSVTDHLALVGQGNLVLHGGADAEELAHFIEGEAEAGG